MLALLIFSLAPLLAISNPSGVVASDLQAEGQFEVRCASGRSFRFSVADDVAIVEFENESLRLRRRDFSLGEYFGSDDGALVIDGDFVAFVPRDDRGWRDCLIVRMP